jgi:hypothetical protein
MPYGEIRVDTITFTNAGVDKSITVSGLFASTSGNLTVTGTISGTTFTGTTANFTSGNVTTFSGGTCTITSGVFASGTATNPSISFITDSNTGLYSPGADQLAISTGGTGRLFVDSAGRVLIGQTTTGLQAVRSMAWQGSGEGTLYISHSTADGNGDPFIKFGYNAGEIGSLRQAGLTGVGLFSADYLNFGSSNTERMRLDASGSFQFKGAGTAGVTQAVSFNGSAPVNSLVIDSSGRLLVGTSTGRNIADAAQGRIQVETTNYGGISITNNIADPSCATLAFGKQRSGAVGGSTIVQNGDLLGAIFFGGADGTDIETQGARIEAAVDGTPGANDMPGRLVFSTTADGASSPTERMRITSGGRFNNVSTEAGIFSETTQTAGTSFVVFQGRYGATAGNPLSGTTSFQVFSNGNVQNTNNSYGAISDIKLKENIVDANSQWDDLKALQVRNYNFKEGQTHTQIGLVAQEVELVSPGLVTESPDRDAEGNDLGTVTKSVNYSVLYMKAVKALQEAMERIETLEAKVAALEGV